MEKPNRFAVLTAAALDPSLTDVLPVLAQLLRFQVAGRVRRSVRKLAEDVGKSTGWVQRRLAALRDRKVLKILAVLDDGSYVCELAERFLPAPRRRITAGTRRSASGTRKNPSSGFYEKPLEGAERETAPPLSQDEISEEWIDAATNERRVAGLPDADLKLEWRKLVNRMEGQAVSRWRWIDWALKAHRCTPARKDEPAPAPSPSPFKGREREVARVLGFYESGFWLRSWGPRPDQPGCEVAPAILAWAQETAASRRAAA